MKKNLAPIIKILKNKPPFWAAAVYIFVLAFLLGMVTQQVVSTKKLNFPFKFAQQKSQTALEQTSQIDLNKLQEEVLPAKGYTFNIKWGEIGKKMVADGVIDEAKLAKAVAGKDTLPPEYKKYLDGSETAKIELNQQNAQFWV
ncbi:hypothetical protein HY385_01305, partial [Candidatus Daviesbacteria bacterium]|nr:hypothetical protein [Candidatus Daviesbacteria bacterium]